MTAPTASSMKLKFSEFASVANGTIEFAIEEAGLSIDNSWIDDAHQTIAFMYLAAHSLMVTISRAQSGTGQRIKSDSMDDMSITYDTDAVKPDPSDYTTTTYGTRFLELVRVNHPGVLLI